MTDMFVLPLIGGLLIGLSAALLLVLNGRIAGVSGILGGALTQLPRPPVWRLAFVGGLVAGGAMMAVVRPASFPTLTLDGKAIGVLIAAGLLVGFGTRLGSGCTSGHGVCGISRLSPRSIVATITFIAAGVVTVLIAKAAELY